MAFSKPRSATLLPPIFNHYVHKHNFCRSFDSSSLTLTQTPLEATQLQFTAFVGGFPQDCTQSELQEFFADSGNIIRIQLNKKKVTTPNSTETATRLFAFIDFDSQKSFERALQKTGVEFKGNPIRVLPLKFRRDDAGGILRADPTMGGKKIYIGNLDRRITKEKLSKVLGDLFGEVILIHLPQDRETGKQLGFGFVVFASKMSAENALRKRRISIDGKIAVMGTPLGEKGNKEPLFEGF